MISLTLEYFALRHVSVLCLCRVFMMAWLVVLSLLMCSVKGAFQGPADMMPFVGQPVFTLNDEEWSVRIVIKSAGKADFHAHLGETAIKADCLDTNYRYDTTFGRIVFEPSIFSCITKFRSALLGYWSRAPISFVWNAVSLTLTSTFAIPFVVRFDPEETMKDGRKYDLVGFLV